MKNKILIHRMFTGIVISVIVLISGGCLSINQANAVSSEQETQYLQTLDANNLYTATSFPTVTSTETNLPISTLSYTWTPLPTIQPGDVDMFVQSLHKMCKLPCWGNIAPGETSEMEAKHLLSSFGKLDSTSVSFEFHQKPVVIDLTFKDGVVTSVNLPPEITGSYQIDDLLSDFGIPEDIRIEIIPETADGNSWFYLVVFFPKKGYYAVFTNEGKTVNSIINVCLENVSPDLYLVKPDTYSLEQINGFLDPVLQQTLKPLGNITEINKSQFYEIFSTNKDSCLPTKIKIQ